MDITQLQNISSQAVKQAFQTSTSSAATEETSSFDSILGQALDNINTTNSYLSDAENEEIKWALGETDNSHDLAISLSRASTALQYTVAVRDRLLEAYREIMQLQI